MVSTASNKILATSYRPIQPGLGRSLSTTSMCYQEIPPHPTLRPYVYCYWTISSTNNLDTPFWYRIVPDGCVDLFINCEVWEGAYMVATMRSPFVVPLTHQVQYFGVRFMPGQISTFFPVPICELVDRLVALQDLFGTQMSQVEEKLFLAGSTAQRVAFIQSLLLKQVEEREKSIDPRVLAAIAQIYRSKGQTLIEKQLAEDELISPRHLRRLFQYYLAISPKLFSRVIRFQNLLRSMLTTPKQDWTTLALNYGYYDQAHFIHEFRALYGEVPTGVLS